MKILKLIAATAVLSFGAHLHAATPYTPPEFVESEWNLWGVGSYEPGVFDNFSNEYPEPVDCKMYRGVENENKIWVEPYIDESELQGDGEYNDYMPIASSFILDISNPDKVWVTPIWAMHPFIFCYYHIVPEVMGMQGSEKAYATLDANGYITFPAGCFMLTTIPSGSPSSNNGGTFAINLPNETGVSEVAAEENQPAVYFDIFGMKVEKPEAGKIYIEKKGEKSRKVIF